MAVVATSPPDGRRTPLAMGDGVIDQGGAVRAELRGEQSSESCFISSLYPTLTEANGSETALLVLPHRLN